MCVLAHTSPAPPVARLVTAAHFTNAQNPDLTLRFTPTAERRARYKVSAWKASISDYKIKRLIRGTNHAERTRGSAGLRVTAADTRFPNGDTPSPAQFQVDGNSHGSFNLDDTIVTQLPTSSSCMQADDSDYVDPTGNG